MGIPLSTAGISVKYAVEATAGTRPTTGFIVIPDIKEIPELNSSPESLDATDLSAQEYRSSIPVPGRVFTKRYCIDVEFGCNCSGLSASARKRKLLPRTAGENRSRRKVPAFWSDRT